MKISILFISNNTDTIKKVKELTKSSNMQDFLLDFCHQHNDAISFMETNKYDAYIIDHHSISGNDLLVEAKRKNFNKPVIILINDPFIVSKIPGANCYVSEQELLLNFRNTIYRSFQHKKTEDTKVDQQINNLHIYKLAFLGEMLGIILHEINNPLTLISAQVRKLQDLSDLQEIDTAKYGEEIDKIAKNTEIITKTVKSLLNYVRQGSPDDLKPENIKNIVSEAINLCSHKISHYNINLTLNCSDETLNMNCRAHELVQVFVNLINNAVNATSDQPHRNISINIYAENAEKIIIEVENSGKPLPENIRALLLNSQQVFSPDSHYIGLGLKVCRMIINNHQGKFTIDPHADKTCFIIYLPKTPDKFGTTTGQKILVVDDSKELREIIEEQLDAAGYAIYSAADSVEGLNILSQNEIDLVIADYHMPGYNGVDFYKIVKQKFGKNLPFFIFITAFKEELDQLSNENLIIFEKPFFMDDLVNIIKLNLNK